MLRKTGYTREEVMGQSPLVFRGRETAMLPADHVGQKLKTDGAVMLDII